MLNFRQHLSQYFSIVIMLLIAATACMACSSNSLFNTSKAGTATSTPQSFGVAVNAVNSGLDKLESYRANFVVDFDGIRGRQTSAGHIESLIEVNRADNALHHYLNLNTTLPNATNESADIAEFYRLENKIYVTQNDKTFWFEAGTPPLSPADFKFLELDKLIVLPKNVPTAPKFETLNGQDVQKFTFTQNDLSSSEITFERAEGSVWLSVTKNLVVQYVISGTITANHLIPNAQLPDEGYLNLRYTLADLNGDVVIAPPSKNSIQADTLFNLPRPPDARLSAQFPTLIEYSSVISPVSATLFYRNKLPLLGWTEEITSVFNEKARLAFSKENQSVMILINSSAEAAGNQKQINVIVNLETRP